MKALNWLVEHWETILGVLGALLGLASVITKLTPSPKDDGVVAFLQRLLGRFSALQHKGEGGVKLPLTSAKEASRKPFSRLDKK